MTIRLMVAITLGILSCTAVANGDVSNDTSELLSSSSYDNLMLADNRRKDRRDDRGDNRDDKQDCRQEEGRVGDDKRECKQDARDDDEPEAQQGADA